MKAAIVVLADTESYEGLGRIANALTATQEFKEAGDEIALIFDGAGVRWIGELAQADHKYHDEFEKVRDTIGGVCRYCADAFQVKQQVEQAGLPFADDYKNHPSFRSLLSEGYQVITF
jgi:hypothetical protein